MIDAFIKDDCAKHAARCTGVQRLYIPPCLRSIKGNGHCHRSRSQKRRETNKKLRAKVKSVYWSSRRKYSPSLTCLPEHVALLFLTFLTDEDLWRSANTCSLFYKAFFSLTKGDGKLGSKRLVNLAHYGHKFPRVKALNLDRPPKDLSVIQSVGPEKFPSLRVVRVCYLCVQQLPRHPGVTVLHMIGCEFDSSLKFPYKNLLFLSIENSVNEFSAYSRLPQLLYLRSLLLSWCPVSHKITARRFPKLRYLQIRGYDAPPPFFLPDLEELILNIPEQIHTQPQNNLKRLKVITNGDDSFLARISERMYPRLEKLEVDLGIKWKILDLSLLPSHMRLSHLRIASRGTVDIGSLTGDRFPSLMMIDIDADHVDLTQFSGHPYVSHLVVPSGTETSVITPKKWPSIKVVEENTVFK